MRRVVSEEIWIAEMLSRARDVDLRNGTVKVEHYSTILADIVFIHTPASKSTILAGSSCEISSSVIDGAHPVAKCCLELKMSTCIS